jgi:thiamine biosynthesis lipoprotein
MGTTLRIEVDAPHALALDASEEALVVVEGWELVLSTWEADAELARANRAPVGECAPISVRLAEALAEAGRWVERTGGAFDPVVGALVDAWDLRGAGRMPAAAELEAARAATGWHRVVPGPGPCLRRLDARAWIDSGGFGKGLALRDALATLHARGLDGLLDFGGQVVVAGVPRNIVVAHPAVRSRPAATIARVAGSAATSSQSEHRVVVDGAAFGHLLDPRTGRPVPAWGSVTVVTDDPFTADVLSTALYVLGPDAALAWAAAHPDVGVLALEGGPAPRARWSAALDGRVTLHRPFTQTGAR